MKILIVEKNGSLTVSQGKSIVVEFNDREILELAECETPLPATIPDGIHVWGGRVSTQEASGHMKHCQLSVISVASNGIIIKPYRESKETPSDMVMSICDKDGSLQPVNDKNIVLELNSGKQLEIQKDYASRGVLVWGGREPMQGLSMEELKERTKSLGLYPVAANVIHVFPYEI